MTRSVPRTPFYRSLESGIRHAVRVLRDHGVNTTCSCHHLGHVQFLTDDPEATNDGIKAAMRELGQLKYFVNIEPRAQETWHGHVACDAFKKPGATRADR
jgi:hypothetical protein